MARDHVEVILSQWRKERPDIDPSPMGIFGRMLRLNKTTHSRSWKRTSNVTVCWAAPLISWQRCVATKNRSPLEPQSASKRDDVVLGRYYAPDRLARKARPYRTSAGSRRPWQHARKAHTGGQKVDRRCGTGPRRARRRTSERLNGKAETRAC